VELLELLAEHGGAPKCLSAPRRPVSSLIDPATERP
jgi:hypothetical protein